MQIARDVRQTALAGPPMLHDGYPQDAGAAVGGWRGGLGRPGAVWQPAVVDDIYEGTNQIQRMVMARQFLK